jgi:hypothetical protein
MASKIRVYMVFCGTGNDHLFRRCPLHVRSAEVGAFDARKEWATQLGQS